MSQHKEDSGEDRFLITISYLEIAPVRPQSTLSTSKSPQGKKQKQGRVGTNRKQIACSVLEGESTRWKTAFKTIVLNNHCFTNQKRSLISQYFQVYGTVSYWKACVYQREDDVHWLIYLCPCAVVSYVLYEKSRWISAYRNLWESERVVLGSSWEEKTLSKSGLLCWVSRCITILLVYRTCPWWVIASGVN